MAAFTIPRMTHHFDVCIRGAGMVGQTLALLLARERLRVALVRAPARPNQADDVRAYALNLSSRALMESVRVWPDEQHATPVQRMQVFSDGGAQVTFDADALGVSALTWIVDVPALLAQLAQAVSFQPGIEVFDTPQSATLTVVCEGKASQSRAEFGVRYQTTPYHQTAIATRVQCAKAHAQTARQWFANGEIMAFLPLDGATGNLVAVVWSVPTDRATQLLQCSPEDFAIALQSLSQDALGAVRLVGERAAWPLLSAQAQHWVGATPGKAAQAWALAGDAAHAVHPLAGQGLNMGLGDVKELVKVLREREYWRSLADTKLLRRYQRARRAAVLPMGAAMDGLQQLLTRADTPLPGLREWGMQLFESSGPLKRWVAQRAMGGVGIE